MEEAYREVCHHEAGHFVCNRLIQQLDIGFPETTAIIVHDEEHGETWGSWLDEWDTENTYKLLQELKEKELICKVAQIIYLAAGFISYRLFVDENLDKCQFERMHLYNSAPSDFRKVEGVMSLMFDPTRIERNGRPYFANNCVDFLNLIKLSNENWMNAQVIKETLEYTAYYLYQSKGKKLVEERLEKLKDRVDKMIDSIDFSARINELIIQLEANWQ